MLHKHDDAAVDGWDPEDHPQSVLSGRTNDEVAADPDRVWTADGEAGAAAAVPDVSSAPTADELAALDALAGEGHVDVAGPRARAHQPRQGAVPRAATARRRVTKRDLIRYYALIAPVMLPYLADRPLNLHRFPDGVDTQGLLAEAGADARARRGSRAGATTTADAGRERASTSWPTARRRSRGWPTTPRSSCTRGRRGSPTCTDPTYALIDIDPGTETTLGRPARARPAAPHRARAPRRARLPEGRPASGASRSGSRSNPAPPSTRHARVGRAALAGRRRRRAASW